MPSPRHSQVVPHVVDTSAGTRSGQSSPFRPPATPTGNGIRITFKGLSFVVKHRSQKGEDGRRKELFLLNGVDGFIEPNQLCALMGPSGSGKTTLLDVLAGRKTTGRQEGEVLFSGQHATVPFLRRYAGCVEQFDTLLPILTVREMLTYTAELKRPRSELLELKKQEVERLLRSLALMSCADVRIGSPDAKGISGGQAKRTNIAIALITNPRTLFLDEPTTGLDSYTANEVMGCVKRLAAADGGGGSGGVTLCATLHSPTAFCFSLVDRLMMLVGGRVVYFGAQDASALAYFSGIGHAVLHGHASRNNRAEFLVDIIAEADKDGKGDALADAYASSSLCAGNRALLQSYIADGREAKLAPELAALLAVTHATATPWWWGIRIFIKYRTSKNYRDPAFLLPRVVDKLFIGLLVMTLYLGVGDDFSASNIFNIAAVLFIWSATTGFVAASYIPSLVLERGLFVRERSDGLYLVPTYLTAKLFDELAINSVATLGIAAFTFYGIQLQGSFFVFWITYYVCVCVGVVLAYFVASIAPTMDIANALLPIYAVTLLFFAGFLIRDPVIPPWWYWYSVINFARYGWGAVMINQFQNNDVMFLEGQTVLQYYNLDGIPAGRYIGFASLFFLFFYLATLLTLTFKKYQLR